MAAPTELCFGDTHGQNVKIIDITTATWDFQHSDGVAFMEQPMRVGDEVHVTFTGSGHAEMGIAYKDPSNITPNSRSTDCKSIVNVRIHKRETLEKVKLEAQGNSKTVKIIHKNGEHDDLQVGDIKTVWLMVYLKFGNVDASLSSVRGPSCFHRNVSKDLEVTMDRQKIYTKYTAPDALCYVKRRFHTTEGIRVQVSPSSIPPPSQYLVTVGYSTDDPADCIRERLCVLLESRFDLMRPLDKRLCNEELHIGLNSGGLLHVMSESKNMYYGVKRLKKVDAEKGIFIIFQLYRTQISLVSSLIEKCPHETDLHEEPHYSSESIPYVVVRSFDWCKKVERSLEHDERGNNNLYLTIEGWAQDLQQERDDYLTPRSQQSGQSGEYLYRRETDSPTEDTYDQLYQDLTSRETPEHVHERLYEKIRGLEKRLDEESKKSSKGSQELQEYKVKLEEIMQKIKDFITSRTELQATSQGAVSDIPSYIKSNAPIFIQELELFPLCDYLLSKNVITFEKYHELHERHTSSRNTANREFMMFLVRYTGPWDAIVDAFRKTRQEHLLGPR